MHAVPTRAEIYSGCRTLAARKTGGRRRYHETKPVGYINPNKTSLQASKRGSKTGVMFVCLGNICRSPTAEAVFKSLVNQRGLKDQFIIDSCGTGGGNPDWYLEDGWSYHEGDPADDRMRQTGQITVSDFIGIPVLAISRGITLTSTSRPLRVADLNQFDIFVAMDTNNVQDMTRAVRYWARKDPSAASALDKIVLMTDFCSKKEFRSMREVPDPYYGGPRGFDFVLDVLTDACEGLLDVLTDTSP